MKPEEADGILTGLMLLFFFFYLHDLADSVVAVVAVAAAALVVGRVCSLLTKGDNIVGMEDAFLGHRFIEFDDKGEEG